MRQRKDNDQRGYEHDCPAGGQDLGLVIVEQGADENEVEVLKARRAKQRGKVGRRGGISVADDPVKGDGQDHAVDDRGHDYRDRRDDHEPQELRMVGTIADRGELAE